MTRIDTSIAEGDAHRLLKAEIERLKADRARQQETVSRLTQENLTLHAQLQAMRRKRAGQDTTALIRKSKTK